MVIFCGQIITTKEGAVKLSLGRLTAVFLTILTVMLIGVSQSSAEIYRWVDENGVTHFSDQKPVGVNEGKEETVDPSKSGSLSVMEGGEYKTTPSSFMKELFTPDTPEKKPEINRNASVVIYTTPT